MAHSWGNEQMKMGRVFAVFLTGFALAFGWATQPVQAAVTPINSQLLANAIGGEIPGISLTDFTVNNGNVNTHYDGVDIAVTVKQRRAFFDYQVTFTPTDELGPNRTDMLVYFGVHDSRVGGVAAQTINGQPLTLDDNDFATIDLTKGKQTVEMTLTLPDQKRFARMLIIVYVRTAFEVYEGHRIDTGLLFSNYASAFTDGRKKIEIVDTQAKRAELKRPQNVIPTDSVAARRLKISKTTFSKPEEMRVYLNDAAISDDYLFLEKRWHATSKKSIANLWGADELYNPEKGLYYLDEFEQDKSGDNFGLMFSVIAFDEAKAKDGEITIYYPAVGTYETMDGQTHQMGAYLTMSDFLPGSLGENSGGPGDQLAPFLYLSNNLYSGFVYNKLGNLNVRYDFVDPATNHVLDVQQTGSRDSVLTATALNSHKTSNPFGSSGASWRAYAEGVSWVTGDRNKVNTGIVTDDSVVSRYGQRYIGTDDDKWVDVLNGTNYERAAVSFPLDGKFATLSMGSSTNGVRQQILTSKLAVPKNHNYEVAITQTATTLASEPVSSNTVADFEATNDLADSELTSTSFWQWTYIDTYDTSEDYLITPDFSTYNVTLPTSDQAGVLDRVVLDTPNIWNVGDELVVYNTLADGSREKLVNWTDYQVEISDVDGRQSITIKLRKDGQHRIRYNGGTWVVGMRLKHSMAEVAGQNAYQLSATVALDYFDDVYNRTSKSTTVTYYRGGAPAKTQNSIFQVLHEDENGVTVFGHDATLVDATGAVVEPVENLDGSKITWQNLPIGKYDLAQTKVANTFWRYEKEHQVVVSQSDMTVDGESVRVDAETSEFTIKNDGSSVRLLLWDGQQILPGAIYMITSSTGKEYRCPLKEDGRLLPNLKRGVYHLVMTTAPDGYEKDATVYGFKVTETGVVSDADKLPVGIAPLPVDAVSKDDSGEWQVKIRAEEETWGLFPLTGGRNVFGWLSLLGMTAGFGSWRLVRRLKKEFQ
jgi:hypothetical protein